MIIKIDSKNDTNGNRYQLIINDEDKTIKTGYSLFWGGDVKLQNKKEVKEIANVFINAGYKKILDD